MLLESIVRDLQKSFCIIASVVGCGCVSSQRVVLAENSPVSFSAATLTEGDDPHAYGFKIGLCYEAGVVGGILFEYGGSVADPFRARLENLRYDNATGDFKFEADIVDGAGKSEISNKWVPVTNHVSFSGKINEKEITGVMFQSLGGAPNSSSVTLKRQAQEKGIKNLPSISCARWMQIMAPIVPSP